MRLLRALAFSFLVACSPAPIATSAPSAVTSGVSPVASASAPVPQASQTAPAASSFSPHAQAPEGPAPFSEAAIAHRDFRQIIVGMLPYPGTRISWTLDQGATTAKLLETCEAALGPARARLSKGPGVRIDGSETAADLWIAGGAAEAIGKKISENPLTYRFEVREQSATVQACRPLPPSFLLACKNGSVPVLAARAKLIVGQRRDSDQMPPFRWQPSGMTPVSGLICEAKHDENNGATGSVLPGSWSDWNLVFATKHPVEWVHENSDMVVQTGAYRRLP